MNESMFDSLIELQNLLKGTAGSQSMAMLNNVMAETLGMSMHNAITTQHNAQLVNTAATTSTCARILSAAPRPAPAPAPVVKAPMVPIVPPPLQVIPPAH